MVKYPKDLTLLEKNYYNKFIKKVLDLKCKKCGCEIHVKENELIPECPTCGINTRWKLK
jgi:predicted RNA-binding Zn-ribbon protein involved in translation (DUF1610 family)